VHSVPCFEGSVDGNISALSALSEPTREDGAGPGEEREPRDDEAATDDPVLTDSAANEADSVQGHDVELPMSHGWKPAYLRRTVIGVFGVVVLVAIVAIEILNAVSDRNNGLVGANEGLYYLWTFGPVTGTAHSLMQTSIDRLSTR
jgi:hypothetical protein